jgi:hypothetical protein
MQDARYKSNQSSKQGTTAARRKAGHWQMETAAGPHIYTAARGSVSSTRRVSERERA